MQEIVAQPGHAVCILFPKVTATSLNPTTMDTQLDDIEALIFGEAQLLDLQGEAPQLEHADAQRGRGPTRLQKASLGRVPNERSSRTSLPRRRAAQSSRLPQQAGCHQQEQQQQQDALLIESICSSNHNQPSSKVPTCLNTCQNLVMIQNITAGSTSSSSRSLRTRSSLQRLPLLQRHWEVSLTLSTQEALAVTSKSSNGYRLLTEKNGPLLLQRTLLGMLCHLQTACAAVVGLRVAIWQSPDAWIAR